MIGINFLLNIRSRSDIFWTFRHPDCDQKLIYEFFFIKKVSNELTSIKLKPGDCKHN